MIVEYLRYGIDDARQAEFIAAYKAAAAPLLASPFAKGFDMRRCAEDPSQFILRIGPPLKITWTGFAAAIISGSFSGTSSRF
jgi:hypothetical protein